MTAPHAIRQFVALVGGDLIAKGSVYYEPAHTPVPDARIIGQCDYLAFSLTGNSDKCHNPFALGTVDAARWSAGKYMELKCERQLVRLMSRVP